MSAPLVYKHGVDWAYPNWTTGTAVWVLATSAATISDQSGSYYLADALAGGAELVDTSYARQTVAGATKTFNDFPSATIFDCDGPVTFGALSDAGVAEWLLLVGVVTDDTDSPIITATKILYTADGTDATFELPGRGVLVQSFTCPSVYS